MSIGMCSQITSDVTALLNGASAGTFTPTFTAARRYVPANDLESLGTLTVSVVPKKATNQPISRAEWARLFEVDIAVQKKLSAPENLAEIDALTALADEIATYLMTNRQLPVASSGGRCMNVQNEPIYDVGHMRDMQVFTSLLTASYQTAGGF